MANRLRILVQPFTRIICSKNEGPRAFHRWVAPTLKVLNKRKKDMGPQPPQKRSNFIEWNYQAELFSFGKRLGEEFEVGVLRQALTERSYIQAEEERLKSVGVEPALELESNESLANSGTAFLQEYTLHYLNTILPRLPQQYIWKIKDDLLKEEQLAHISANIGINDIVLSAEHPPSVETLANSFKAVVEALALSSGRDRAGAFVRDFVITELSGKDLSPLCTPEKPLSVLQEIIGAQTESRLIAESGRNSVLPNYQVGIYLDKKLVSRGCGENPAIAEEMAALDGLWRIWGVSFNRRPFPFNLELPPPSSTQPQV